MAEITKPTATKIATSAQADCDVRDENSDIVSPELSDRICNVQKLLQETPGNPEFNRYWDFRRTYMQCKYQPVLLAQELDPPTATCFPVIAGQKGKPSLRLVSSLDEVEKGCSIRALACSDPLNSTLTLLTYEAASKNLDTHFMMFYGKDAPVSIDESQRKILYESLLLHELTHAEGKSGEYVAYRRQANYLAEQGLVQPLSDEHMFRVALQGSPSPLSMIITIMERFEGKSSPESHRWLPGGDEFNTELRRRMKDLNDVDLNSLSASQREEVQLHFTYLQDLHDHGWKSKFKEEVLSGIEKYYEDDFLQRELSGQGDPSRNLSDEQIERRSQYIANKVQSFLSYLRE